MSDLNKRLSEHDLNKVANNIEKEQSDKLPDFLKPDLEKSTHGSFRNPDTARSSVERAAEDGSQVDNDNGLRGILGGPSADRKAAMDTYLSHHPQHGQFDAQGHQHSTGEKWNKLNWHGRKSLAKAIDDLIIKYEASIDAQRRAKEISDKYFKLYKRPPTSKELDHEMKISKQDGNPGFTRHMPDPEDNPNYEYGNGGEIQLKPENAIDEAEAQIGDNRPRIKVGKHHTIDANDAKIMASDKDNWVAKSRQAARMSPENGAMMNEILNHRKKFINKSKYPFTPEHCHEKTIHVKESGFGRIKCPDCGKGYVTSQKDIYTKKSNDNPNIKGVAWDALTPEQKAQLKATRPDLFVKKSDSYINFREQGDKPLNPKKLAAAANKAEVMRNKERKKPGSTLYPLEDWEKKSWDNRASDAKREKHYNKVRHNAIDEEKKKMNKANDHTSVEVSHQSNCDFCGKPAVYDGKTTQGPWANMCDSCFKQHGTGVGLGKGQKLIHKELIDRIDSFIEKQWWEKGKYKGQKNPIRGTGDDTPLLDAMASKVKKQREGQTHCDRCGEKLGDEDLAEVTDKNGKNLIIHAGCKLDSDKIS